MRLGLGPYSGAGRRLHSQSLAFAQAEQVLVLQGFSLFSSFYLNTC